MSSLYRHRAINLFLPPYSEQWLQEEDVGQDTLVADLCVSSALALQHSHPTLILQYVPEQEADKKPEDEEEEAEEKPDPLLQLIQCFQRAATSEQKQAVSIIGA